MERKLLPKDNEVVFKGPPIDERGWLKKNKLLVGNAESLLALTEEYAFFTPAALYVCAGFTDAPLIDYVYEMRQNVPLYYKKFNRPIFRGLETPNGDADWNHVLWAVRREFWASLHDFLAAVTLSYRPDKHLVRVASQDLLVIDPLVVDQAALYWPDFPVLPVTAFGINGNKYRAAFVAGQSRLLDPPALRFFAAADDVRAFADAYYNGANPVDARSNFLNNQSKEDKP